MKHVVIIGAGPAGLTAGYEILKKSSEYKVTILEESNMIGGISRTIVHNGNRMDIGGHRFFSKDERVIKWWNDLLPLQGAHSFDDIKLGREKKLVSVGPDPEIDDRVMLIRDRVSRIYYLNKFFDYPISLKIQTIKNLGFVRTMKAGISYLKTIVYKKKEDSLENFYINRFGKILYNMFFERYTEKLWGRHPREISAEWGAQRVKGLSITAVVQDMLSKLKRKKHRKVETSLIEEFYYPKYGPGQLWETVACEVEKLNGQILKNSRVVKINLDDNLNASSVEYNNKGKISKIDCDLVISSMPIKDLIKAMDEITPSEVINIAQDLPYRDFVTIGILVKSLNLKNHTSEKTLGNIIPDCWIYVQDAGVKLGRIQIFNNWSPYMVNDPENTVWLGLEYFCDENDEFWNLDEKKCVDFAVNELVKIGIITNQTDILDYHREKVKKAYPAYFDSFKDINKVIDFLNTIENLYCVGRNGQHRYNNMDHSMVTSYEAVDNILSGKSTKENIWNVNTEKSYHEDKK